MQDAFGDHPHIKDASDHRKNKRYPFKWRVAIVFASVENEETYHGVTHDVSASGCSILTEHNIFSEEIVSVLISLPVEHPGGRRKLVEVQARMVYTVLSAGHQKFRCGIEFLKFKGNGRKLLTRAFEMRDITTPGQS